MNLYPYNIYCHGFEQHENGSPVKKGYYIYYKDTNSITSLEEWFSKR